MDEKTEQAERAGQTALLRRIEYLLAGLFILFLFWSISLAKDVMLPLVLGALIALTLSAPVRWLSRRGVPRGLGAAAIILSIGLTSVFGLYMLRGPAQQLMQSAPEIQQQLRVKLWRVFDSFEEVKEASEQVEEIASGGTGGGEGEDQVVVDRMDVLGTVISSAAGTGTALMIALILAMFLLASGDMFQRKLVESFPLFRDKKKVLRVTRDVERQISRYLAAITVINAGLGLAIGITLYLIGMPYAYLWGVAAFLLNYLPYLGALGGVIAVAAVSLVTFDTVSQALLPPVAYLLLTSIEGQMVTPWLVGRHLRLNAAAIFVAVIFWAWLWGVAGALMAVPFLVLVKLVCDNVAGLHTIGRFLDGETAAQSEMRRARERQRRRTATPAMVEHMTPGSSEDEPDAEARDDRRPPSPAGQ